jgi:hypothetical protein
MSNTATEALCVAVEREMPFPPGKIWRQDLGTSQT